MESKTIMLFRHGAVDGQPGVYKGKGIDTPLSPLGERQTRANIAAFRELGSGRSRRLVTSPADRCRAALAYAPPRTQTEVFNLLDDIDIGEWAGLTKDEAARRWPEIFRQIYLDARGVSHFPGAEESVDAFRDRCHKALNALLMAPEEHIALVTHGRVIEEILGYVRRGAIRYMRQGEGAASILVAQNGVIEVTVENVQVHAGELLYAHHVTA